MKYFKVIVLIVFLGIAVLLWVGLYHDPRAIPSPLINKPLPDFNLSSLTNSHPITQNIFKGHISLLHVFASWCTVCQIEHPVLMDIANSKKITVYGLNYKDKTSAALQWLADYGNPYRDIIKDTDGSLAIDLGVYGTPETFLLDRRGIIRYKYIGAINMDVWKKIFLPKIKEMQS